jgi:hypothetical protein
MTERELELLNLAFKWRKEFNDCCPEVGVSEEDKKKVLEKESRDATGNNR